MQSCAVVQQTLSEYYHKLDSKSKAQYFEKTVLIRNDDPYAMEKSKFCRYVSLLPALRLVLYSPSIKAVVVLSTFFFFSYPDIVNYLLHTTSFVTLEEVKNYISHQSFKYFTSGWVLEVEWKEEESIVLIITKVRHRYMASKSPLRRWVLVNLNGIVLVAHCIWPR